MFLFRFASSFPCPCATWAHPSNYFMAQGLASILTNMADGTTIEVGTVGVEGDGRGVAVVILDDFSLTCLHRCDQVSGGKSTRTALLDNWTWGLSLIALTIAIHATGVTFMVSVLHSFRLRLESRNHALPHLIAIGIAAFTAMGLLLAVLHGIEAAFWAAAYLWFGALDSPGAALLYSVDSMATRGASGLMLQSHWQMMGALEAADGMLLFGISTAFIFTVMHFYYQHLLLRPPAVPSKPDRP